MGNNVNVETSKLFKKIDGKKVNLYFSERPELVKGTVSTKALSNRNFVNDAIRKNRARIALWNNVCDVLEVPRDFFDYVEPPEKKVDEETVPEKTAATDEFGEARDVLISILLTQKKQEALLLDICKVLKELM